MDRGFTVYIYMNILTDAPDIWKNKQLTKLTLVFQKKILLIQGEIQ
jgi:hypothetical protein